MGLLQKSIERLLPEHKDLDSSDDGINAEALGRKLTVESVVEIVEDMRKEFLNAANTDQSYLTINRNEIAVWKWFEKWLK